MCGWLFKVAVVIVQPVKDLLEVASILKYWHMLLQTSSDLEHDLNTSHTLQQWNRPRARKVEPIPVDKLGDR